MPVVIADLHSALPAIVAGLRADAPTARIAYVLTDGGALPAWYSRTLAGLASELCGTVSTGQAFGGDVETVTVHSGLLAARHVLGADIAVVTQGPGNLGTGTPWGFSGVAAGEVVNAVGVLGGRAVGALRISGADPRERHRGVSHHSLTAFGRVALAAVDLVVPDDLEPGLAAAVAADLAGLSGRQRRGDGVRARPGCGVTGQPRSAVDDGPKPGRGLRLLPDQRRRRPPRRRPARVVRGRPGQGGWCDRRGHRGRRDRAVTDLLLVRHGETSWNATGRLQGREDIPLNDVGTAQAAAAARGIAHESWDAVVSSPLIRALGTAQLIADACGLLAPTTDADLVERSYGEGSGMFDHEIRARWPDWVLPGSETRIDVVRRAMPALDRIAARHPDGRVVVVSHGGLIRSVVMGIEGQSESARENIANLGTTLISNGPGHWTVAYYNRSVG